MDLLHLQPQHNNRHRPTIKVTAHPHQPATNSPQQDSPSRGQDNIRRGLHRHLNSRQQMGAGGLSLTPTPFHPLVQLPHLFRNTRRLNLRQLFPCLGFRRNLNLLFHERQRIKVFLSLRLVALWLTQGSTPLEIKRKDHIVSAGLLRSVTMWIKGF